MSEVINCPNCGAIFMKTAFRSVCQNCWKEEEKAYETVYQYMRKRENRAATIEQVVEATEVSEELIYKFVRAGRIQTAHFPNLGYPCDKCGHIIRTGKICGSCQDSLRKDLKQFNTDEQRKKELKRSEHGTYLSEK
ncbi:TIGR03826 family flagellar region protein [Bacillus sp. CGMCC 1.16607]|uniref:TIGR03826 family flagellar region protein n=1 Tax=Bacillus sp. CGMCC 1.16607 TaxID=3351842 RepID=UPI003641B288